MVGVNKKKEDGEETKVIRLSSNDGVEFSVELKAANQFQIIRAMIESLGMTGEGQEEPAIPVNLSESVLKKMIEWAIHHKDDPKPEKEVEDGPIEIPEWDAKFLEGVDREELFELIRAANYLDVKGLLDVALQKIANQITGKTQAEIRGIFLGIPPPQEVIHAKPAEDEAEAEPNGDGDPEDPSTPAVENVAGAVEGCR